MVAAWGILGVVPILAFINAVYYLLIGWVTTNVEMIKEGKECIEMMVVPFIIPIKWWADFVKSKKQVAL